MEGGGLEPAISVLKAPGGIGDLQTGVRPFKLTFLGATYGAVFLRSKRVYGGARTSQNYYCISFVG